jgi:hypothetical protein
VKTLQTGFEELSRPIICVTKSAANTSLSRGL